MFTIHYSKWILTKSLRLYTLLVMDSLVELGSDAQLAGLNYNVQANGLGIEVTLFGFNDKLPVLAHRVLERIKDIKVELKRLLVIRDYVSVYDII